MVFVTNNAAKVQLLFELLSTTWFFRGKATVRCYPPVSVPRVAVKRIPIRPPAAAKGICNPSIS